MHRFYLPPENFRGDYIISNDLELINQLAKVLRARHGDKFLVFNNSESEFVSQLVELSKKEVKFLIIDQQPGAREPSRKITLYQSLLKSDKFDWLIQKAVELGVSRIVPVYSKYCIVKDITAGKRKRYEDIIKEATEQCGGVRLPLLAYVIDFKTAIEEAGKLSGAKLIAWEKETEYDLADAATEDIQLFIGPEGGYSEEEIEAAKNRQIVPVTLGKRILRAETAAIAALAKLL
ncbi:MAG: RsmE family RNA methyltransferase [Candidatus Buchananbacteria bacterium]|jgi:16S rRNA (uracil1498-N3)-methyltransferase